MILFKFILLFYYYNNLLKYFVRLLDFPKFRNLIRMKYNYKIAVENEKKMKHFIVLVGKIISILKNR